MRKYRLAAGMLVLAAFSLVAAVPALAQTFDEAGNDLSLGTQIADSPPMAASAPPDPAPGCLDTDLQTSAVASSSGGGAGDYGPQIANDGAFSNPPDSCPDWCWIGAGDSPGGAWFQLTWAEPVEICQIFVDTKAYPSECSAGTNRILSNATIQWWDGASWVTEATVSGQTDDWGHVFENCVTTDRLRLFDLFTDASLGSQAANPILYELKVYGCGVPPAPAVIPTLSLISFALLALLLLAGGGLVILRRKNGLKTAGS